jgi:hypothetical protein
MLGERAVQGFDVAALRDLLGLPAEASGALSADELLDKYRLVFGAAQRAILQISQDALDWVTPGRERTLRQLTWHIFDRAEDFLRVVDGGEFTAAMVDDYLTRANLCRTSAEIAAYGQQVLSKVEDFLTRRRDQLEQPLETYFGRTTAYDLLNRALSMAAFRLTGTYGSMRMIGIEPVAPLGPEDFSGIVIPSGSP